jgi:hypothetical protein
MKMRWRFLLWASVVLGVFLSSAQALRVAFLTEQTAREAKHLRTLKQIYDEVKEMGRYPGEDFTRREFFIGNEDDDDTNKNQHVVVLIQNMDGQEKMRIQVTYMEPAKENPQVKYAKDVKSIFCQVVQDKVTIQTSDYNERELEKLALETLRAVQSKKKLLKSCL